MLQKVNRIATQTTFAGKTILNGMGANSLYGKHAQNNGTAGKAGDDGSVTLQVGSNKGDTITFNATLLCSQKLQKIRILLKIMLVAKSLVRWKYRSH